MILPHAAADGECSVNYRIFPADDRAQFFKHAAAANCGYRAVASARCGRSASLAVAAIQLLQTYEVSAMKANVPTTQSKST